MPEAVGALLLTGGASRRMGTPKAALPAGPSGTIAERIATVLLRVAAPVIEVGPQWTGLPAVHDEGAGPLVATARGWAALTPRPDGALLVACDLPRLTEAFLRTLLAEAGPAAVVPEVGGRLQPLCAFFPAAALDVAVELVAAKARALTDLLAAVPYRVLPADAWADALADVDTPSDLLRLGPAREP
jgi:molybdopterin-guanine dinucleotide biosynthesis protein A